MVGTVMDWNMKTTGLGNAYVDSFLVWGIKSKGLFFCDKYPKGTKYYQLFQRMGWCSPKQVQERRR